MLSIYLHIDDPKGHLSTNAIIEGLAHEGIQATIGTRKTRDDHVLFLFTVRTDQPISEFFN